MDNFLDDMEKMRDFIKLSKEEFLKSYSYLTVQEYDATAKEISMINLGNVLAIDSMKNSIRKMGKDKALAVINTALVLTAEQYIAYMNIYHEALIELEGSHEA